MLKFNITEIFGVYFSLIKYYAGYSLDENKYFLESQYEYNSC